MMKRILFMLTMLLAAAGAGAQTTHEYYRNGTTYVDILSVTVSANFMGMNITSTSASIILAEPGASIYHLNCQVSRQGSTTHYYTSGNAYILSTYNNGASLTHNNVTYNGISASTYEGRPQAVKDTENVVVSQCTRDMTYGGMRDYYSYNCQQGTYSSGGGGGYSGYSSGGGSGYSSGSSSSSGGYQKATCSICHGDGQCRQCTFGNGVCKYCGGYGYNTTTSGAKYNCSNCNGTGKCGFCHGGGKCQPCGGTGKR